MERLNPLIKSAVYMGAIGALIPFAFSTRVKNIIRQRDGYRSVWSGETDNLECAHINHDKRYRKYNHESNGRLLTSYEHCIDHINRHGHLGLPDYQNIWGVQAIYSRLSDSEQVMIKDYLTSRGELDLFFPPDP